MNDLIRKKLSELEQTLKQYWNVAPESAGLLNLIIKASGYKNIIEVGTSNGYSTIWFAEAVSQQGGFVTGIEFSEKRRTLALDNFKECELSDYIDVKQGSALDILNDLNEDQIFDMAFIDANKGEYIKYYEILDKKIRSGGLIAADNVLSHQSKVQNFIDAISSNPDYLVSNLPLGGGLLLALKK